MLKSNFVKPCYMKANGILKLSSWKVLIDAQLRQPEVYQKTCRKPNLEVHLRKSMLYEKHGILNLNVCEVSVNAQPSKRYFHPWIT